LVSSVSLFELRLVEFVMMGLGSYRLVGAAVELKLVGDTSFGVVTVTYYLYRLIEVLWFVLISLFFVAFALLMSLFLTH
jgi:hypothetical protein